MQNGAFFTQNALFIHFSYEYCTFLIHSKIHSIVQQKYSFKEFIHSKNNLIIHSIKILIFLKKCRIADPYRPRQGWLGGEEPRQPPGGGIQMDKYTMYSIG